MIIFYETVISTALSGDNLRSLLNESQFNVERLNEFERVGFALIVLWLRCSTLFHQMSLVMMTRSVTMTVWTITVWTAMHRWWRHWIKQTNNQSHKCAMQIETELVQHCSSFFVDESIGRWYWLGCPCPGGPCISWGPPCPGGCIGPGGPWWWGSWWGGGGTERQVFNHQS